MPTIAGRRFQSSLKVEVECRVLVDDGTFPSFRRFECLSAQLCLFRLNFGVCFRDWRLMRGRLSHSLV
jgi:hypothetical protein